MTDFSQIKEPRVTEILAKARRHVEIDIYMPNLKDDKLQKSVNLWPTSVKIK